MQRRTIFFALFALTISLGCARLGIWQVSRLRQRQARNALVFSRLEAPPVPVANLVGDTTARFRRAVATGRYDFEHELIYALRSRDGSPGVNILTPLMIGGDTALLVNRGWVYSPNGILVDLTQWRDGERESEPVGSRDSAHVEGFVEQFITADAAITLPSEARALRRLDHDSIGARLPYHVLPLVLVQRLAPAASEAERVPVRVEPPPLSEGSHRAYAVQWFGFAVVGLVGTALVVTRDRRRIVPALRTDRPQVG